MGAKGWNWLGVICLMLSVAEVDAQSVYIGSNAAATPDASAILQLDVSGMGEKKGVLMPSMTEDEMLSIDDPATALLVFQTDPAPGFYYYDGSSWTSMSGWGLKGNAGIDDTQQFLGTNDDNDLVMRTNGVERLRLDSDGNILFKSASSANEWRFYEPNSGSNYTAFKAPALTSDVVYTLPAGQGASGEVLTNDGSGNLSWSTPTASPSLTPVTSISIGNGSTNDDMDVGDATFVHLSGSNSSFDITGFEGGTNGKMLVVYNTGNGHMRIKNEDSGSEPENRIWTLQGGAGTLQTTAQGAVVFIYDGNVQRWIAVSVND